MVPISSLVILQCRSINHHQGKGSTFNIIQPTLPVSFPNAIETNTEGFWGKSGVIIGYYCQRNLAIKQQSSRVSGLWKQLVASASQNRTASDPNYAQVIQNSNEETSLSKKKLQLNHESIKTSSNTHLENIHWGPLGSSSRCLAWALDTLNSMCKC